MTGTLERPRQDGIDEDQEPTADDSELQTDNFEATYGSFRTEVDGIEGYMAGKPGYENQLFPRDLFVSRQLDPRFMQEGPVDLCTLKQGQRDDPRTGEQRGKMPHQWPGARLADKGIEGREDYETTYNACDTTALYLIDTESLEEYNPLAYDNYLEEHRDNVELATEYILAHVDQNDNIFRDFPPEGADKFALRITDWKDSVLPDPDGKEEPTYPVAYALAHFKNARGLLSASKILDRPDLADKAADMFQAGIRRFIREDGFTFMQDADSELVQPSSDELHSLAYIPEEYADMLPLEAIRERALDLETPAGIACTPKAIADKLEDKYHGNVEWPPDNAFCHRGATKFGLYDIGEIAERCAPFIGPKGNELLNPDGSNADGSNEEQLWSVAAAYYFTHDDSPLRRM